GRAMITKSRTNRSHNTARVLLLSVSCLALIAGGQGEAFGQASPPDQPAPATQSDTPASPPQTPSAQPETSGTPPAGPAQETPAKGSRPGRAAAGRYQPTATAAESPPHRAGAACRRAAASLARPQSVRRCGWAEPDPGCLAGEPDTGRPHRDQRG